MASAASAPAAAAGEKGGEPILYSYWRSSSAWRVRAGLELLGVSYEYRAVHLVKDGGEHKSPEHAARSAFQHVPVLEIDGVTLNESLAMLEYLEETRGGDSAGAGAGEAAAAGDASPVTSLLPPRSDPVARAKARSVALAVACNIQPIQNLRVLQHVSAPDGDMAKKKEWANLWIGRGLEGLEKLLEGTTDGGKTRFCCGDKPTIADCLLVPQIYNAVRWGVDMERFPICAKINANCAELDAFKKAHPDAQPDAVLSA